MSVTNAPGRGAIAFRADVTSADVEAVRRLVAGAGVFSPAEVEVAVELAEERRERGAGWGYHFILAERARALAGYACYGPIPATAGSFDLYWLVVDPGHRRAGVARGLVRRVESSVRDMGGERLFVQTSSRDVYAPARAFYVRSGFREVAVLPEYFGPGDDQVVYARAVGCS